MPRRKEPIRPAALAVRRACQAVGIPQAGLAEELGVSKQTLHSLLSGKSASVPLAYEIDRWAKVNKRPELLGLICRDCGRDDCSAPKDRRGKGDGSCLST